MKNKKPLKIILLVCVLELVIIGIAGYVIQNKVHIAEEQIINIETNNVEAIQNEYNNLNKEIMIVILISAGTSIVMYIALMVYLSKMVMYPLKKIIENKKRKDSAEEIGIKTRLLHMTEGIIAFDINGNIDLINPAAKLLLKISPEDETFQDIFDKFDLNINMEKLIYLEELTKAWDDYQSNKQLNENSYFFSNFRKHCIRTGNYALHKCSDEKNGNFIVVIKKLKNGSINMKKKNIQN